jgi:hypothetical protein
MENTFASGRFHVLCYDKNGDLKWEEKNNNLVVNTGIQYMAGVALTGTTQILNASWYIGLVTGPGSGTTFAAGDTMASHAGWTEFTGYSQGGRVSPIFTAATNANPSVVTNASVAVFSISASGTIAGAFLTSNSLKGGTTGTLFSASDFTGGDRTVVNSDTLNVTYTFSLTAT